MEQITLETLDKVGDGAFRKVVAGIGVDKQLQNSVNQYIINTLDRTLWRATRRPCAYVAVTVMYGVNPLLKPR